MEEKLNAGSHTLNTNELAEGFYIVQFRSDAGTKSLRLIKTRK